jgi:hypothetical protein
MGAIPVTASADEGDGTYTCSGTPTAPGVLTGHHGSVRISGVCGVTSGPATVDGKLTLLKDSALIAAFGTGNSRLTVDGNVAVGNGATLILGCIPTSFPCFDDNPSAPTLSSHGSIDGRLTADQPLGVIVHNSSLQGGVSETGGGGGVTCNPTGIFAFFGSPAYSDYEDNSIEGNVTVSNLRSCWLGLARNRVEGSITLNNNRLADPDAVEILSNTISGNLTCRGNSTGPDKAGNMYDVWDSVDLSPVGDIWPRGQTPNTVGGKRVGQCNRLQDPSTQGGARGPLKF